jgi:hypothetical protein
MQFMSTYALAVAAGSLGLALAARRAPGDAGAEDGCGTPSSGLLFRVWLRVGERKILEILEATLEAMCVLFFLFFNFSPCGTKSLLKFGF